MEVISILSHGQSRDIAFISEVPYEAGASASAIKVDSRRGRRKTEDITFVIGDDPLSIRASAISKCDSIFWKHIGLSITYVVKSKGTTDEFATVDIATTF